MAKRPSKKPLEGPEIRILVAWKPHHGSRSESSAALEYAAWIARTTPIRIQMVTTFVRPWPSTSIAKLGGKYKKWHAKETQACAAEAKKSLSAAGIPEHYWDDEIALFLDGTSEAALLAKAARDFDASLILMSSVDVTVKGRFLAGSTMESLLSATPTPIGLMPESTKLSKRGVTRLTYGFIDGEQDSAALLETATRATTWDVPLRIVAFAPDILDDSILLDPLTVQTEISVQWREHLFALLDRAKEEVATAFPNLQIETEIGSGGNWAGAVDAVKWKKGDLLSLSASPMNPLERVFVGSATSHILQFAPVPTIVRPVAR
ncbi:Universal stress protein family protein [Corynebacterium kalinowskii]|uniref:Universal stress protein family protein n=1 Tax=Corynebacterium kalinowskii TaxID=2675216 RepID=A0A6B8VW86_9CORY|nr:universal stress protein [Corynebacterium kalinowskii]QGU03195.1 Universal stress protein family protein [Corynebacterium kalinowskii]